MAMSWLSTALPEFLNLYRNFKMSAPSGRVMAILLELLKSDDDAVYIYYNAG